MSISSDYVSIYNSIMNVVDEMDANGSGMVALSQGTHTTRSILEQELGIFTLGLADCFVFITRDQAELLDMFMNKGFTYASSEQIKGVAATLDAHAPEDNASINAFMLQDAMMTKSNGVNTTDSTDSMIKLFELTGMTFILASGAQNALAKLRIDNYVSGLRRKALTGRAEFDNLVGVSAVAEEEPPKPESKATPAKKTGTTKKTTSTSNGTKKTSTGGNTKKSTGKKTKKGTTEIFDDTFSFELPVGYEMYREEGDDGEGKVFIRYGKYVDDNGNDAYEFNAMLSYTDVIDSDDDEIPAGERPLDTINRRNPDNKHIPVSEEQRTELLIRETPINILGTILKYYGLLILSEQDEHRVFTVSDITVWNEDDPNKNLEQYKHITELLGALRIDGKALPALKMNAEELLENYKPEFDGKGSIIKGSIGLQIQNGDGEVVSESTLVGDDDGVVHTMDDHHGPNKLDGKYEDYEIKDGGLRNVKKNKRVVHIPDGVTSIESNAFDGCKSLTEVTIPDSVSYIGMAAFNECIRLKRIVIPEGVKEISWMGFCDCSALTEIIIPSTVTEIGMSAFSGCKKLEAIVLPDGLETLARSAFRECESLKEIVIPEKITEIEDGLFANCKNLAKIEFKGEVTAIKDSAFWGCTKLKDIEIPKTLVELGESAFLECANLEKAVIPEGITFIEDSVFRGCKKLKSIELPAEITSIGNYAFLECESLTEINLPQGLEKIGENAFNECKKLKNIGIPDSVTEIGQWAFSDCESLTEITIPERVEKIETGLVNGCKKLKRITMPEKVDEFGDVVFDNCDELTEISLPDGMTEIGDYAFAHMEKLKTVHLPSTIENLGSNAFSGCVALQDVTLPDALTAIPEFTFYQCGKLKKMVIPDGVTEIGNYAFSECESLASISIPDGITVINDGVFDECRSLKSITLPDGITSIGTSAFKKCTGLTEIDIPDGVESIGDYAFDGCTGLRSIVIPDSVRSIGNWAFDDCDNLKDISMPGHDIELGGWALPNEDEARIVYRSGTGRVTRRKPAAAPKALKGEAPSGSQPKRAGKYTEVDPSNELYSHYGKLKREADKFKRIGVRYEQNNGEEFQSLKITDMFARAGKTNTGLYRKLNSWMNTDSYTLDQKALKVAQIFRVNESAFVARHDDEGDVGEKLMDKKYKLSALRSFAWTLADLADREGKSIDDYEYNDLTALCSFVEDREWLNYEGGSWFDGLCGHDDLHVYYMPESLIRSGEADEINDLISMGGIASLDAFRRDLEQIGNAVIRLHNGLLKKRDRSVKLEGAEAAVILAWCVMAVAAKEPFFSEDGPMFFYHAYPSGPVNSSAIAVSSSKASLNKATPKAKKAEASSVMNDASNYEIMKGPDGKERIKLGEYPIGSPIIWLVLERKGNELLLLSEYGLDAKAFCEGFVDNPSEWEYCTLRKWLNEDFYEEAFDEKEQGMILDDSHDTYKKNGETEENTGNVTDKVFLLSARELQKYFPNQRDKLCKATAFAKYQGAEIAFGPDQCGYWLRSPAVQMMGLSGWAGSVQADGTCKGWGYGTSSLCARPMIRVKSDQFKTITSSTSSTLSSAESNLSNIRSTLDNLAPAENSEEQAALDEAKKILNQMTNDFDSTKSALEKHAEELRRQEEEKAKRINEAKAKGKSSKDDYDMLVTLLIEEDQGNLDRDADKFAELYAEDFGAYSADQLKRLRKKIMPRIHESDFIEEAREDMLGRSVKDRFSISTANWFNLSNMWDFEAKGEKAIEKTKQYYRDSELAEVRKLMADHKQQAIDSVNRQLTGFNASWNGFAGVGGDIHVNIEECSDPIPEAHNIFDVMLDRTYHVQLMLKHPSMGFLTIPIMNLFASVWKTTPEKIWDAALKNTMDDSRGVSSIQTRNDATAAKNKALAKIAQAKPATTQPTKSAQTTTANASTGISQDEQRRQQKIEQLRREITRLTHEQDIAKGLFAGMKKKRLQKEIDELREQLRKL